MFVSKVLITQNRLVPVDCKSFSYFNFFLLDPAKYSPLSSSQPDVVTESLSSLTSLDRNEESDEDDLDRASLEDFSEDEDIKMITRYRSSKRHGEL